MNRSTSPSNQSLLLSWYRVDLRKVMELWSRGMFFDRLFLIIVLTFTIDWFRTMVNMAIRVVEFSKGDTKLERFLPKNQHTQRKLFNFEFWINGELSKIGHHFSTKKFKKWFYQKMSITKNVLLIWYSSMKKKWERFG